MRAWSVVVGAGALALGLMTGAAAASQGTPAAGTVLAPAAPAHDPQPSGRAYAHFLKAKWHLARGELAQAHENLTLAIAFDSESAYLHTELGWLYLAEHDPERAETELHRASDLNPSWWRPRYLLGEAAFGAGRFDEARGYFAAALKADDSREEVLRRLAESTFLTQGQEAALQVAQSYAEAHRDNVEAWGLLARLARVAMDYPRLEAALKELLVADSENTTALDQLATWYGRTHRYEAAIELFTRLIAALPPHPVPYVRLGEFQLKAGHTAAAEQAFAKARAFDEHDARINQLIGFAYLDNNANAQAARCFRTLLAEGASAENRYFLGLSLYNAGRFREAIAAFREVDGADPDLYAEAALSEVRAWNERHDKRHAEARLNALLTQKDVPLSGHALGEIAHYYRENRQAARGLQVLSDALAARPDDPDMLFARGSFYAEQGEGALALADMETLLQKVPDHADALNVFGYLLAERRERLDEAERAIRRAMLLKPDEGYILDSLGFVLLQRGEAATAYPWLLLAGTMEPDEPEILFHLALSVRMLGDPRGELRAILARAAALPARDDELEARIRQAFGAAWRQKYKGTP